jgi:hypothetical protein
MQPQRHGTSLPFRKKTRAAAIAASHRATLRIDLDTLSPKPGARCGLCADTPSDRAQPFVVMDLSLQFGVGMMFSLAFIADACTSPMRSGVRASQPCDASVQDHVRTHLQ